MLERWIIQHDTLTAGTLDYSYDGLLVAASLAIVIFASFTAFNVLDRIRAASTRNMRNAWLAIGALSLGGGIWTMHFVGMLAIRLEMQHGYDVPLTIFSAAIAIAASAFVLHMAAIAKKNTWNFLLLGGTVLGAGIGGMHYTGMTAMHMAGEIRYDPVLFALSIVVAIALSVLTLWMLDDYHVSGRKKRRYRATCAVLMGLSITTMHYGGMAATYFIPAAGITEHEPASISDLGLTIAIIGGVLVLFQIAMTAAFVEKYMQAQNRRLEQSEGLLDSIVENTDEAIIAIDLQGLILSFNNAARRIFEYENEEAIGKNVAMLMPDGMQEEHDRYLAGSYLHGTRVIGEMRSLKGRRKSGETFPLELNVTRMSLKGQTVFVGVGRDATQRSRMEGGLRLLQRVAAASNEAEKPAEALQVALDEICQYSGWPFAHAYLLDENSQRMVPSGIFHPTDRTAFQAFKQSTMQNNFEPGTGLPGRALIRNTMDWIPDLGKVYQLPAEDSDSSTFLRTEAALEDGLKAAFAFPVSVQGKVFAVLEFYADKLAEKDDQLIDLVSNIAEQLGRVFEREQSEQNVILQQKFIQSITTNLFEGVLVVNDAGIIEFSNPAARQALGLNETDVLEGRQTDDIFQVTQDGSPVPLSESVIATAISNRRLQAQTDAMFVVRGEKIMNVTFACAPIRGRSGERSAVISFRDTSELRKAQSDALQASKLASVGELAAGIAHEINSPIQFIGDNLHFIQETSEEIEQVLKAYETLAETARAREDLSDSIDAIDELLESVEIAEALEDNRDAAKQSLRGVERIARIINAMKEFAHPGGKTMDQIDLNRAIQTTAEVCRSEWKNCAELKFDLQDDLPAINCFAGELNQVFLNMIVNAAHAIQAHSPDNPGRITIVTRQVTDQAEVRISDTGGGIPDSVRDKIFDPFFTTKDVGKGTGQGLAIAHDVIVNKHAGKIDVDTKTGHGTTFILRIPVNGRAVETEAA